jgi:hypothetical protein
MTAWGIAVILYALPILAGIRHFEDVVEDARDWMRGGDGEWYPALAPLMAAISLVLWPLFVALEAIAPGESHDH